MRLIHQYPEAPVKVELRTRNCPGPFVHRYGICSDGDHKYVVPMGLMGEWDVAMSDLLDWEAGAVDGPRRSTPDHKDGSSGLGHGVLTFVDPRQG